MKKILLLCLLCIGYMINAQRLVKYTEVYPGDWLYTYDYIYDNGVLCEIVKRDKNLQFEWRMTYDEDTLRFWEIWSGHDKTYEYGGDTVYMCEEGWLKAFCLIDDFSRVTDFILLHHHTTYLWENDNCTVISGTPLSSTISYSTYDNPWYNENKYFRKGYQGSCCFIEAITTDTEQFNYNVIESEDNYPTLVEVYAHNTKIRTLIFEYQ